MLVKHVLNFRAKSYGYVLAIGIRTRQDNHKVEFFRRAVVYNPITLVFGSEISVQIRFENAPLGRQFTLSQQDG